MQILGGAPYLSHITVEQSGTNGISYFGSDPLTVDNATISQTMNGSGIDGEVGAAIWT